MADTSLKFLETFLNTSGPSGFETAQASVFRNYLKKYAHKMEVDVLGNSIAVLNPDAEFKVMLAGHYDEIGFQVVDITENGLITFRAVGGIDKVTLPALEVDILTEKGLVPGVIGRKPIHLQTQKERETVMEISDLWIDIGAESREEAEKSVSIADPIVMRANCKFLGKNAIMSKGLDDKIGAYVIAEAFRMLAQAKVKIGVYAVGTVQEELGLRGAETSAFGISPNVGIAVDVGFATDVPGIDRKQWGNIKLGGGPLIAKNADANPILFRHFHDTAKKNKIPYQLWCGHRATGGTDTAKIQMTRSGVATLLISIPNRYMHTPVEICDIRDAKAAAKLIAAAVASLNPECKFRPGID